MRSRQIDHNTFTLGQYYYETEQPDPYPDAMRVQGDNAVAWYVYGWEVQPDDDTEWSGCYNRTGLLVCCMVGDDQPFVIDPDDLQAIDDEEYCHSCGQIGCGWC